MIDLTKRQRDEADRHPGIELVVPYPAGLRPPALALDEECEATEAEALAAAAAIALPPDYCLRDVRVALLRQQDGQTARHYLMLEIRHSRWGDTASRSRPKTMWSAAARAE